MRDGTTAVRAIFMLARVFLYLPIPPGHIQDTVPHEWQSPQLIFAWAPKPGAEQVSPR